MSPYEHFFWNYALFFRKPWAWKVGVGGLFPDLVYGIAFHPKLFFYRSFMEWMHDPLWDTLWNSFMARSVHSLVLWGAGSLLIWLIVKKVAWRSIYPFFIGWGLHIYLMPLPMWVTDTSYSIHCPIFNLGLQSHIGRGTSMPENISWSATF